MAREDLFAPIDPSYVTFLRVCDIKLTQGANRRAPPLGRLVIKVLAAKDLTAKDRNGSSDPFCVIRYGPSRITGPTITRSLNPIWQPEDKNELGVVVHESRGFGRERVEVVLWDKDRVGREYLGEVALGLEEWWDPKGWKGGVPPFGITDEGNKVRLYLPSVTCCLNAHERMSDV